MAEAIALIAAAALSVCRACAGLKKKGAAEISISRRIFEDASWGLSVAVLVSVAGCAYQPRPVLVDAGPAEWRAMVGTWRGSYSTASEGRRGLIDFTLAAGESQAFGDVLMIAPGTRDGYGPVHQGSGSESDPVHPYSAVLTIRFIRASDGRLMGEMARYWDPDRQCEAKAVFYGAIGDGRMDGTFTSLCADGAHALRGRWSVTRTSGGNP